MVVENEIIIKQRRKNKTAGNFQKFRADAGCIFRVNGINPKTLARWIYQQRLEARQVTTEQIEMLLCGIDFWRAHEEIKFSSFSTKKQSSGKTPPLEH